MEKTAPLMDGTQMAGLVWRKVTAGRTTARGAVTVGVALVPIVLTQESLIASGSSGTPLPLNPVAMGRFFSPR